MCAWGAVLIGYADTRVAAVYEPAPFSHYQPILDRMPFGAPPPVAGSMNPEQLEQQRSEELLQAEQQQVAKQIAFTALNVTPRGRTTVGFVDRSVNPPESYYLEVGASAQGWTVVDADYNANWAQFEKDGVTITMHLHKGLIDGPPSEGTNNASASPQASASHTGGGRIRIPGCTAADGSEAAFGAWPCAPAEICADGPADRADADRSRYGRRRR
ncbi:MAG: hypothetical protein ACOX7Q_15880 [Kiritimatiellia bacterium]